MTAPSCRLPILRSSLKSPSFSPSALSASLRLNPQHPSPYFFKLSSAAVSVTGSTPVRA
jgi:hypothetical protein